MNDLTLDSQNILAPLQQEGTQAVLRTWLKAAGAQVARDEPVAELETDKVVVEVCAPCAGHLQRVLEEGQAVAPGALMGRVSGTLKATAPPPAAPSTAALSRAAPSTAAKVMPSPASAASAQARLSPSVRRLLADHNLSAEQFHGQGTGRGGRLTREDVVAALAEKSLSATTPAPQPAPAQSAPHADGPRVARRVPHTPMRRAIAEHMQRSVSTAPHVTAMVEADVGAIIAHRSAHKARFAEQGAPLTFTAYFVMAAVQAMAAAPAVNSRWHADALELFEDINIGVGTALGDQGLVVPVIHSAQSLSLLGIARRLHEQTQAARAGRLQPTDVRGGTFTLSNHGVAGTLLATPIIINQPQSAILGIGAVEKRVVVKTLEGVDALVVRPRAYVTLTIDHRVLDGNQANAWLKRFVEVIEGWA
jgi:2-oxoglutarate dehydrogenase E2 component (dihydrolipoamide succinyltransferase)